MDYREHVRTAVVLYASRPWDAVNRNYGEELPCRDFPNNVGPDAGVGLILLSEGRHRKLLHSFCDSLICRLLV